ncbi:MAG: T9SS type A sorting domain-containing protein [Saprospiraceae bacterium]|nr:T9SS type A sorting domain-containing protein [Saprospiraceae bacterium]
MLYRLARNHCASRSFISRRKIEEDCRWWLADRMVKFENCTSNKISYRLSDLLGRVIYEFHPGKDGNNSSPVLGTGIYILSAMDVNGKMSSNKLLVH